MGTVIGLYLMSISLKLIGPLLALAGGAMAFIVKNELLPESYRHHPNYAKLGFVIGVILILLLNFFHG